MGRWAINVRVRLCEACFEMSRIENGKADMHDLEVGLHEIGCETIKSAIRPKLQDLLHHLVLIQQSKMCLTRRTVPSLASLARPNHTIIIAKLGVVNRLWTEQIAEKIEHLCVRVRLHGCCG